MSLSNVASLIPQRDSDSSDDEFLDALEKIENEPEDAPQNGTIRESLTLSFFLLKTFQNITKFDIQLFINILFRCQALETQSNQNKPSPMVSTL